MTTATATFHGEEITVHFRARMVRNDYGVRGSPVWYEPEDVEIETMEILGVSVDPKTLSKELLDAIYGLTDEIDFQE